MKRLLLCVDGSRYAISCSQHAAWLASLFEAEIEVVYVTDLRQFEIPFVADLGGSLGLQPYQAAMGQLKELEERKATWIFEIVERTLRESGFDRRISTTHRIGFLVDSLRELESQADLIVLGKRGENANYATEHLGSMMERVARSTQLPCFIVSREYRKIGKVLLAVKSVKTSQKTLEYISQYTGILELEIHVVSIASDNEEAEALKVLNYAEKTLKEAGCKAAFQMLHGFPSQTITGYVERNGIDLIVMGASAHSRIRHLILGSTVMEILKDCRLASLLVR